MNLRPLRELRLDLDFTPRRPWPEPLPAMAIDGYVIAGFDRLATTNAINLTPSAGEEAPQFWVMALRACYGKLSLIEASRFRRAALAADGVPRFLGSEEFLARLLELRVSDELGSLLDLISLRPRTVQDWLEAKEFMPRELAIWLDLSNPSHLDRVAEAAMSFHLSRSDSAKALEWAGELLLLGQDLGGVLPSDGEMGEQWLERLRRQRFPRTLTRDQARQDRLAQIPWPAHVWGEWRRQGDQDGLEIHLRVRDAKELNVRMTALKQLSERLESEADFWKA